MAGHNVTPDLVCESTGLAPTQFTPASPNSCLSYVRVWAKAYWTVQSEVIQEDVFDGDTGSRQQQPIVQFARDPGPFL